MKNVVEAYVGLYREAGHVLVRADADLLVVSAHDTSLAEMNATATAMANKCRLSLVEGTTPDVFVRWDDPGMPPTLIGLYAVKDGSPAHGVFRKCLTRKQADAERLRFMGVIGVPDN